MILGMTIFQCPKCGKVFKDLNVEYHGLIYSSPMPCPVCKTLSAPLFANELYERLGIIKKESK